MNFSPRAEAVLNSHVQREMNALREVCGQWKLYQSPLQRLSYKVRHKQRS